MSSLMGEQHDQHDSLHDQTPVIPVVCMVCLHAACFLSCSATCTSSNLTRTFQHSERLCHDSQSGSVSLCITFGWKSHFCKLILHCLYVTLQALLVSICQLPTATVVAHSMGLISVNMMQTYTAANCQQTYTHTHADRCDWTQNQPHLRSQCPVQKITPTCTKCTLGKYYQHVLSLDVCYCYPNSVHLLH